ncbi:MAG TPA: response regulator [Dongiaceae bacterium]|nr:response regulator [Dongiaceae bacterium]
MELDRASTAEADSRVILLVEDDSLIRMTTAEYLRSVGYNVVEAATADEGARVLSSGTKIHLVFSDVSLPGDMGGFSLAIWVRRYFPFIPVILMSGLDSAVRPLDRQHLIPFIAKPFRMEDAGELIASELAKASFAKR